ncbi:ABC-three component system protein [Desulfosporosinus sp. OT]|uniref:ABC-three component system protein n=1 Tax=Desulfosporosinus sp. OT TaxID=913865 RepID=UPI000223AD09|nr:ABC-three component system protein [Desulfosporosinus sp. OT]EGW41747.1 hypothetical protein DOT_0272 [Desulfosporosinus sp. OT]
MLNKLRLDQTKIYEKHLALKEISNMLVFFVKGHPHHLAIGAEQGNIDKWDDFVIEKNDGSNIYIQAKRQTTPFSSDAITRDTYGKGSKLRVGQLKDLSPLDESLESLGKWINSNDVNSAAFKHEFWLVLPESSIEIKKGLEIRHLRILFEDHYKSITTAKDLDNLAVNDNGTQNIYNWLRTWCGFNDWDHILKLMQLLKIKSTRLESEIIDDVKEDLKKDIFQPIMVDKVCSLIFSYMEENQTFAGAIRPRQLLFELREYLLPDIARWTLFQNDRTTWHISGINDLKDNTEIERPSVIVPALWTSGNPNARELKIEGACIENCCVSQSLMRLSLHPQGLFGIICSDKPSWENAIKNKTGGTLGLLKNDLDDLRILGGLNQSTHSEKKELAAIGEQEQFANELQNEMYKCSFEHIKTIIFNIIRDMTNGDLRTEVEKRWITWKPLLENNIEEQKKLFTKMLHPQAEGKSISGELRVGLRTAVLLAESIFLLLVVSVCLGDDKNRSWKAVKDQLKVNSIGLAYWSGPAEEFKKIMEIDADEGIGKLLEKEPGEILIIPQSELPEAYVFNDDIFGGFTKGCLLSHPRYPKLLITQGWEFKRKLKSGSISDIREYLQGSLDRGRNNTRIEVEKIANGVMV